MSNYHNLIQISDTHLFGDKNRTLNGANPYNNLVSVFEHIKYLQQKPELIIVSGDLSQDCTVESYKEIENFLSNSGINYKIFPGNHDDVDVINKVFKCNWKRDKVDFSFELNGWYFYVLDSSLYPNPEGYLSNDQLDNFKKYLSKNNNKSLIVFMHHHPTEINSAWLDKMLLKNADEFNKIIDKNPQVKAVLFGHIHQVFDKKINNVYYQSAPSTAYQVRPNSEMFTIEKLTPGYRLIELGESTFNSRVVWME